MQRNMETKDDGEIFTVTVNGFTAGVGSGTILALKAYGSKACMAQLTFKPKR